MNISKTFFILCTLLVHIQTNATNLIFEYDQKTQPTSAKGIIGITQESSWECRGYKGVSCKCSGAVLYGKIAHINKSKSTISDFTLKTTSADFIIYLKDGWLGDIDKSDYKFIPDIIKNGKYVLTSVDICGVNGGTVVARDIYTDKYIKSTLPQIKN